MGKVYKDKVCGVCGTTSQVIETWGKYYCRDCYKKKRKIGFGHSGMLPIRELTLPTELWYEEGLWLEPVEKGNKVFATLYLEHYPQSKGIVGRQCNYFVKHNNDIVGIIGGNSPPLNYKKFSLFFGVGYTERNWLNNNVFRLVTTQQNWGTQVLKLFRERLQNDYQKKYGDVLIGLVTFVEPPRNGAVYKADNWVYLGITEGKHMTRRGDHGKWINKEWSEGTQKLIFAKWLGKKRSGDKL